ncbi:MAG: hypothetical protein ACOY7L_17080 [Pseudomonadota bacterium]
MLARLMLSIAITSALGGCSALTEGDEVRVCEAALAKTLRSPSTYSQVSASILPYGNNPRFWSVSIEYDVDNAFGTPVRGHYQCMFKANPDGSVPAKVEMEIAATDANMERVRRQLDGKPLDDSFELIPCCVSGADRPKAFEVWLAGGSPEAK